jgi:hypothetical protein
MSEIIKKLVDQGLDNVSFFRGIGSYTRSREATISVGVDKHTRHGRQETHVVKHFRRLLCEKCPYIEGMDGIKCSGVDTKDVDTQKVILADLESDFYISESEWDDKANKLPCEPLV